MLIQVNIGKENTTIICLAKDDKYNKRTVVYVDRPVSCVSQYSDDTSFTFIIEASQLASHCIP